MQHEPFQVIDFTRELRNYRNISSLKSDFYIYLEQQNVVISSTGKTDANNFFQNLRTYEQMSVDDVYNSMLSGVRQQAYVTTDRVNGNRNIIFVQSLPIWSRTNVQGYLVIHFDDSHLRRMLERLNGVYGGDIHIFDHENKVIVSNDASAGDGMFLQLPEDMGYEMIHHGGESKMLSYTHGKNDWKYVSVVPRDTVMKDVDEIKNRVLLVIGIGLLIGLATALIMTYRHYTPIRTVVNEILKVENNSEKDVVNELEFIRQSVSRSLSKEKSMKRVLERNQPMIQAHFLSRFMKGYLKIADVTEDSLGFMDVRLDKDGLFAVVLIELDEGSDFFHGDSEKEWGLARFTISNLAYELIQENGYVIEMERSRLAILYADEGKAADVAAARDQWIRLLQDTLHQRFRMNVTLAVSGIKAGLEEIPQCYREALMAMDYRMIYGTNAVIHYEMVGDIGQQTYQYPLETEVQLINHVKSGDCEEMQKVLRRIYEVNFVTHNISPEMGRCLFFDMTGTILKLMNGLHIDSETLFEDADDPLKTLSDSFTVEEMFAHTTALYTKLCRLVREGRTDRSEQLYRDIVHYIDEHFGDSNLSLSSMADHFGITPQYLSTFFKRHSRQNLNDYVAQVRIREAKKLLENTSQPLAQIAGRIGYANDIGFIRLFKKHEGITPGSYRKNKKRQQFEES
ncbi:helix-turn-helix domain-containing protein [Paenibacillus senegalensis]|uniref:helix-turn-helix domain-containing protein n=1 Tax=Paenibacillus senegalensis TaxID=1465766 RepID=UPI0002F17C27|nr:helix-turn-helix domain-containing protein [Paenibacillus senegalensis]